MYRSLASALTRRALGRLVAGDPRLLLATYRADASHIFPGQNSWAGEMRGKAAIAGWLQRFIRTGLQLQPHDILVGGPPWNMRVAVLFTDQASSPTGKPVYKNRGVLYVELRWLRIVKSESFEDTEKVAAFDRYLAEHQPELLPADVPVGARAD